METPWDGPSAGKPAGHHGRIANIMASMDVIDVQHQQFIAAAQNDLMARMASGEIDTEAKKREHFECLCRGAFTQITRAGEFASFIGCGA